MDTLVGALVINAVSEHFLQDIFAPGHIYTLRDTLGAHSALASHDRHNVMGAVFLIHESRWRDELKPLITDPASVEAIVAQIEESHRLLLWGDFDLWRNDAQRLFMTLLSSVVEYDGDSVTLHVSAGPELKRGWNSYSFTE